MAGDRCGSPGASCATTRLLLSPICAGCCVDRPGLLPCSDGSGAASSTTCATEPPRAGRRRRLHRCGRGRGLRRPLADLARGRGRLGCRGQLRRRGLRRDPGGHGGGRRDGRGRAGARRGADRRSTQVDEALGGLTPAKRHAAQLAADALHRALAQAASSAQTLSAATDGRERVLVAMSGGVDSAVAALLERERGAEVVGVTLKLWADPQTDGAKACCSPEAVLGARALAHSLGIPHLTLDLEEEFRRRVVAEFVSGYAAGTTPNPCIALQRRGADRGDGRPRRAARRRPPRHRPLRAHRRGRRRARCSPPPPTRPRTRATCWRRCRRRCSSASRFPLDRADQARGARDRRPPRASRSPSKPESQDLCFLAGQGKGDFLRRHGGLREREGAVRRPLRPAIGRHRGHHNFTVGQRRGIGVRRRGAALRRSPPTPPPTRSPSARAAS